MAGRKGPNVEDDNEQVERALASLAGVDPERDAQIRKAYAESEAKRHEEAARLESDIASGREQRRERLRRRAIGSFATLIVLGLVVAIARPYAVRWYGARPRFAAIAQHAAPYAANGFSAVPKKPWTEPARAAIALDGPACVIAFASAAREPVRVRVEAAGAVAEGAGSAGLCTCGGATVEAASMSDGSAVQLYRAEPEAVGGAYGLLYAEPKLGALGEAIADCSRAQLDAWVRTRRFPPAQGEREWIAAPMADQGFSAVATLAAGQPFVAFDAPGAACAVAVAENAGDRLTLRTDGGDTVLPDTKRAIGWCSSAASPYSLWREGTGAVHVASVPSKRIGSALGLSDFAVREGLGEIAIWVRPDDLAAAAAEALVASGAGDTGQAGDDRVISIALLEGGLFLPDPGREVLSVCVPEATAPVGPRMCVQASAHPWSARGAKQNVGAAEAPLPFWMLVYADVADPAAMRQELVLLRLARRLFAQHFVPTTLAGVTETATGAAVLGRAGEDAVVAVGLAPQPPWAVPYTDGPAWTLDGGPRIVPLEPGAKVVLEAKGTALPPVDKRRTVVFRRQTKP
jgi:hypothetical protein